MKLVPMPHELRARIPQPDQEDAIQCACGCIFSPHPANLSVVTCPECRATGAVDRTPDPSAQRVPMRFIIADLQAQQGEPMTTQISSLSDILKSAKTSLERASNIAQGFSNDLDGLNRVVDQIEVKRNEVVKATAELQAVFGGISNGGPPLVDTTLVSVPPAGSTS